MYIYIYYSNMYSPISLSVRLHLFLTVGNLSDQEVGELSAQQPLGPPPVASSQHLHGARGRLIPIHPKPDKCRRLRQRGRLHPRSKNKNNLRTNYCGWYMQVMCCFAKSLNCGAYGRPL